MGTTNDKKKSNNSYLNHIDLFDLFYFIILEKETVKEGKKRQLIVDDETPRISNKKKKGKNSYPAEDFTSLPS